MPCGIPCRAGYHVARDTCRVGYRAGWDTMLCGIPCRGDDTMRDTVPCGIRLRELLCHAAGAHPVAEEPVRTPGAGRTCSANRNAPALVFSAGLYRVRVSQAKQRHQNGPPSWAGAAGSAGPGYPQASATWSPLGCASGLPRVTSQATGTVTALLAAGTCVTVRSLRDSGSLTPSRRLPTATASGVSSLMRGTGTTVTPPAGRRGRPPGPIPRLP
jgi:hypothetical protein